MATPSANAVVTPAAVETVVQAGLMRQMVTIVRALYASPAGKALLIVALGIVGVIGATSYGQLRLNSWNNWDS